MGRAGSWKSSPYRPPKCPYREFIGHSSLELILGQDELLVVVGNQSSDQFFQGTSKMTFLGVTILRCTKGWVVSFSTSFFLEKSHGWTPWTTWLKMTGCHHEGDIPRCSVAAVYLPKLIKKNDSWKGCYKAVLRRVCMGNDVLLYIYTYIIYIYILYICHDYVIYILSCHWVVVIWLSLVSWDGSSPWSFSPQSVVSNE